MIRAIRRLSGIFRFTRPSDLPLLVVGSVLIILSAVASPMQTLIYGKIFDRLGRFLSGDYESVDFFLHDLRVLIAAMIAIAGGRLIFSWIGITVWLVIGENTTQTARSTLFESLLHQDMQWLGTKENLVGSITLFFRCIEEIRSGVSENLGLFVQTLASVCCLFVIAMISSWSLTLLICCSIPLSALCSFVFGYLTSKFATRENMYNAKASKLLAWCFNDGSTLRVLNGKYQDIAYFGKIIDKSAKAYTYMASAISANSATLKLLSNLVVVGGLAFGEFLVRTNRLNLGNVITAFSACVLFGSEISSVGDIVALLNKAQASSNTIDKLELDTHNTTDIVALQSPASAMSCFSHPKTPCLMLEMQDASFRYRNSDIDVLDNVRLSFTSEQLNFIVGESGSGKSTVASVLAGFLEKTKGDVFVDDVNYDLLSPDWFTENVCFVESRPLVFERSLAANLLLGSHHDVADIQTIALLDEACVFADLSGFVNSLPHKYNTVLVSHKLSGGQIQKIGLARAWIANRPILILDEALGSINKKSKSLILQNVRHWRQGVLTMVISHDLTDIRGPDAVVVMDKGHVKAVGSADSMRAEFPKLDFMKLSQDDKIFSDYDDEPNTSDSEMVPPYNYIDRPAILQDLEKTGSPHNVDPDPTEIEMTRVLGLFAIVRFCFRTSDHKTLICLGLFCALLSGVATPGLSYCFAEILAIIVKNSAPGPAALGNSSRTRSVTIWSLITLAVAVADSAALFASRMALAYASEQWILKLRKQSLAKINDQDMVYFDTAKPAFLNTLLMNDTRDLRSLVAEFLSGLLLVVSLTTLGLVWAISIGWKLALVGVSFVPLVFVVTMAYSVLLQKYESVYKDHVANSERFALEAVTAIRTVRSFGLSAQLSAEYRMILQKLYEAGVKRAISGGFGLALSELCGTAATATVLYYGMFLVVSQSYTQKQMLQVLTMLTFTVASSSYLMKSLPEIARGQRAGTLITRILDLNESVAECGGTLKSAPKIGAKPKTKPVLAFNNVSFSYPDNEARSYKPVLRDTSFSVNQGEAIVIAGESGSGKSTMARLMTRLFSPDRGHISYLGKNILEYDPDFFREHVALVNQEPRFFEASIYENLLYGLTGSSRHSGESMIDKCLQAVNANDFVNALPNKLDTILGKDCSLSSGQLQRLSIARVLLRRPKVIIFDEPTSRLDSENTDVISSLIFKELGDFDPSLTFIVISHDPRVMSQASRVLLVEKGKVAEDGTFDELLQEQGAFANFMK